MPSSFAFGSSTPKSTSEHIREWMPEPMRQPTSESLVLEPVTTLPKPSSLLAKYGRVLTGLCLCLGVVILCGCLYYKPSLNDYGIAKDVVNLAVPMVFQQICGLVPEIINTVVVGHSGDAAGLAALGLGNMMQNCIALSVGFGLANGMDPLGGQANGAGKHDLTCLYLQRCRIIMMLQLVWMLPVLWTSGDILVYLGQDPEVSRSAATYNRATMWGLPLLFQQVASTRFLQIRGDSRGPAIMSLVTSVLHVGWCLFFVIHLRLGLAGAGYANVVTWFSQFAFTTTYLVVHARQSDLSLRSILWFGADSFRGWWEYLQHAVPSMLQLCTEWWFWEISALIVGYLHSKRALAAHVAAGNFAMFMCMFMAGMGSACAILVGNALGANRPSEAQTKVRVSVILMLFIWSVICVAVITGGGAVAVFYSNDAGIRTTMQELLIISVIGGFFDSSQFVMGAALRGMGMVQVATWPLLIVCYFVSLPLGCFAMFSLHWQVYGMWYAMAFGNFLLCAIFACIHMRVDFRKLAEDAMERLEAEEKVGSLAEAGKQDALQ